jgi:hypothetical protein
MNVTKERFLIYREHPRCSESTHGSAASLMFKNRHLADDLASFTYSQTYFLAINSPAPRPAIRDEHAVSASLKNLTISINLPQGIWSMVVACIVCALSAVVYHHIIILVQCKYCSRVPDIFFREKIETMMLKAVLQKEAEACGGHLL